MRHTVEDYENMREQEWTPVTFEHCNHVKGPFYPKTGWQHKRPSRTHSFQKTLRWMKAHAHRGYRRAAKQAIRTGREINEMPPC